MFGKNREIQELKMEIKDLEGSLKRAHERISSLSMKVNENEESISEINESLDPLQEMNESWLNAVSYLQRQYKNHDMKSQYREDFQEDQIKKDSLESSVNTL